MDEPGRYNTAIVQGITFSRTVTIDSGYDLTGKTARAQLRAGPNGDLLATLTCAIDGQSIIMSLTAEQTRLITEQCDFALDIFYGTDPEVVPLRLLIGVWDILPGRTK